VEERVARFTAEPHVALTGDFDLPRALSRLGAGLRTKGMFFTSLADKLGDAFADVAPSLEAAPRGGRYLPYVDYPSRDHLRLIDAAARASLRSTMPPVSTREAHRRLGATAFERFASSNVGRVVLKLVADDLQEVLLAFPRGYAMTVRSLRTVESQALDDGGVRLEFKEPIGAVEYVLGTFEGIVRSFGGASRIDVSVDDEGGRYDVRWG
jgi:uncharacterized protein (TIGR02265 family)